MQGGERLVCGAQPHPSSTFACAKVRVSWHSVQSGQQTLRVARGKACASALSLRSPLPPHHRPPACPRSTKSAPTQVVLRDLPRDVELLADLGSAPGGVHEEADGDERADERDDVPLRVGNEREALLSL